MAFLINNNGSATLAAPITTATQTSFVVATGKGALFPSPTGGDYTLVTIENALGSREIVCVVGRSVDTMTVGVPGSVSADTAGRGMEGTTAAAWASGDIVEGRATAAIVARGGNAKTATELAASGGAALIGNTPAGNIASTTMQGAINELDTDKAPVAGVAFMNSIVLTDLFVGTSDLIIMNATPVGTYTASQSGNTVTATVGTFSAADVGKILVFGVGQSIEHTRITGYTDPATVTVDTSATIASGAVSAYGPPTLYVDPWGDVAIGKTQPAGTNSTELATTEYADRAAVSAAVVATAEVSFFAKQFFPTF